MSTPPFLELPQGVSPVRVPAARGELAALVADAPPGQGRASAGSPRLGAAAPALLVPGFTGSKEDFIAVLAPLAAAGHRVVAVDQRGQFESPGDDDPTTYDIKALADDVLAVARWLGEPVHLVGHSFGGLVARAAAISDAGAVRSVTLMSSGPGAVPHPSASNVQLILTALPVMDLEAIWTAKRQIETEQGMPSPPPDVEQWLHRRFVASHPVSLLRMGQQLLEEQDRVEELARTGLPTLVLFGAADDAWPPAEQAEMARRLGAQVCVIDGAAHSPAAEQPDATARALLGFWSGTETSAQSK